MLTCSHNNKIQKDYSSGKAKIRSEGSRCCQVASEELGGWSLAHNLPAVPWELSGPHTRPQGNNCKGTGHGPVHIWKKDKNG